MTRIERGFAILLLLSDGHQNAGITEPVAVQRLVSSGLEQDTIRTACLGTTLGFATLGGEHRWVCHVIFFVIIVDRRTRAHSRLAVRRLLAQEPVGQSLAWYRWLGNHRSWTYDPGRRSEDEAVGVVQLPIRVGSDALLLVHGDRNRTEGVTKEGVHRV